MCIQPWLVSSQVLCQCAARCRHSEAHAAPEMLPVILLHLALILCYIAAQHDNLHVDAALLAPD